MKFLFAVQNPAHFLNYRNVAARLCSAGHEAVFHLESMGKPWANLTDKPLADLRAEYPDSFEYGPILCRSGFWRDILFAKREIANYGAYLRRGNPISESEFPRVRAEGKMPPRARQILRLSPARRLAFSAAGWGVMNLLEKMAPLDKGITEFLKREKPDAVVASPYIFPYSEQIDYVKCAAALGIPTVVGIASWDNLTTKGITQVFPDMVMVWNRAQIGELERIHGFPAGKTLETGAPSLDIWFEMKPSLDRESFCKSCGLDPEKPFITYLCSSKSITRTEYEFIENLSGHLKERMGERAPSILIRPHPENMEIWQGRAVPGAVVYPASYSEYYSRESKEVFFHSLYHCSCVIGINTTAIIEAAIVGRPVISITDSRYADTHTGSAHFNHLLNAGFLLMARDIVEAQGLIADAIGGVDEKREPRTRFVQNFIRPWGIEKNSSAIMAHALEEMAAGKGPEEIKQMAMSGALGG